MVDIEVAGDDLGRGGVVEDQILVDPLEQPDRLRAAEAPVGNGALSGHARVLQDHIDRLAHSAQKVVVGAAVDRDVDEDA